MLDISVLRNKKIAFYTLGCKLNFAETSALKSQLESYGAVGVGMNDSADICIINTCSVTEVADHKCRQMISRMVRRNPKAFVLVTGCYAQLSPEQITHLHGVDLVLGTEQKGQIIQYLCDRVPQKYFEYSCSSTEPEFVRVSTKDISTFVPSCSSGEDRTRYFLKVQDGCNYYCTYCTIPFARGKSRNGSIASLVSQARKVAENGGKEIVLTGVNIGDFGRTTDETFLDLIKALDGVDGIERYRISSIEPNLLTDEIVDFCARSRRFMPHFHIPLQSGSNEVLSLMRRKYSRELFRSKIDYIHANIPHAFIGVDVIVGMRGEIPDYFEDAYTFIRDLDIAQLHVFSYSERPGTKALEIEYIVLDKEKHDRSQRLLALSEEKRKNFYQKHLGEVRCVLTEHAKSTGQIHGFTDNYIRVELEPEDGVTIPDNSIVPVQLLAFNADQTALVGKVVK